MITKLLLRIGNHQPAQSTFILYLFSSILASKHQRWQKCPCHFESSLSINVYQKFFNLYTLWCQQNKALRYQTVLIFLGHPVLHIDWLLIHLSKKFPSRPPIPEALNASNNWYVHSWLKAQLKSTDKLTQLLPMSTSLLRKSHVSNKLAVLENRQLINYAQGNHLCCWELLTPVFWSQLNPE